MASLLIVVAWDSRVDGSRTYKRYCAEGLKDLRPPDELLWPEFSEDEDKTPEDPEIESAHKRFVFCLFSACSLVFSEMDRKGWRWV